jgi:putative endonuclease
MKQLWQWLTGGKSPELNSTPVHLLLGKFGETAAKKFLEKKGYQLLEANFAGKHGEIDLIFLHEECVVFVEVKTRRSDQWGRPEAAVKDKKKKALSRTALAYLRSRRNPRLTFRFDIVEILAAENEVREIRHIENAFALSAPYRYGG